MNVGISYINDIRREWLRMVITLQGLESGGRLLSLGEHQEAARLAVRRDSCVLR